MPLIHRRGGFQERVIGVRRSYDFIQKVRHERNGNPLASVNAAFDYNFRSENNNYELIAMITIYYKYWA